MENLYKKALKKIEEDEKCRPKCNTIIGPKGKDGISETISIRSTITSDPGTSAKVIDTGGPNHILDFIIPRGYDGYGVKIMGSYNTYDELIKEHPNGNLGDSYLVDDDLYIWNPSKNTWENTGKIKGPKGDKGDKGDTGPSGLQYIRSAYIVTFNNGSSSEKGIPIPSEERLPLDRSELDISNLVTLDSSEEIIKFNVIGYYKITITVSGYAYNELDTFDPTKDFLAIGLKLNDTDNIYIGASEWTYNNKPTQITAQGIISVPNTNSMYSLVNLSPRTIYLETPELKYIKSDSYFTNSVITMTVEYLGRQGY